MMMRVKSLISSNEFAKNFYSMGLIGHALAVSI